MMHSSVGRVQPTPQDGTAVAINLAEFGNVAVGSSTSMNLVFDATAGALTFSTITNPDYQITSTSCDNSCTVHVLFTPSYPGLRNSVVTAKNSNGNVMAETFVYGTGTGPLLGFELGYETIFTGSFDDRIQQPMGLALGPDRRAYISDAGSKQVYFIDRYDSDNPYGLTTLPIQNLGAPGAIAVDGNNTVYVADTQNNVIVLYTAAGVQGTLMTTQLSNPGGLAVDGAGALYVADTGNNRVIRIDNHGTETTLASSLSSPHGIAVDSAGDVFFSDQGNNGTITELPAGGGEALHFGSGLQNVQALALDAGGTLYYSTPTLLGLLTTNGGLVIYNYGGDGPTGIGVGPNGDLFTALPNAEFDTTDRSSGNFILNAAVGGSAQGALSLRNLGNTSLTLSNIATSEVVYTIDSSSQCTANDVVDPASTCEITVNYNPVTPGADQQTVNVTSDSQNAPGTVSQFIVYGYAGQTDTELALSANSISAGQPVTFTATVSPQNGNDFPTGMVQFHDGESNLGSGTLTQINGSNQSVATFTTSSLSVGDHSISAFYQGSDTQASSFSDTQTVTVVAGGSATTTTLGVSSANINSGTAETLTATVQGGPGISGSVTFYDQTGALGTGTLVGSDSGVSASLTLTNLSVGGHQIYGLYNGSGSYNPSTSNTQTVTVVQASTATALTLSAASIRVGQAETLTATIQAPASPAVTGPVTFYERTSDTGISVLGSATVTATSTGGTASLTVTTFSVGTHPVYVSYAGDINYSASASATQNVTVTAASTGTATSLSVDRSSVVYRTPVAFTASVVTSTGSSPVVAGQVIFCDAAAVYCSPELSLATAQLTPNGTAVARMPAGVVGSHGFVAVFLGTASFAKSSSATTNVMVTPGPYYATFTTIASTGSTGNYGLTGSVTGLGTRALAPGGAVSFVDTTNANAVLGSATLGAATLGFQALQPSGSPVAVGSNPYGIAAGDFNGDGYADLVTGNYGSASVSVLLGTGNGGFQTAVSYAVGTQPERVLVADFNGDGKLDLVVANTGSGTVSVLFGNGDGTFQTQATYGASSPVGLGVMDLNHDGFPDIVAGDYYNGTITVLLNRGDGTFQAGVTYATGITPQTLAEGDFNGDGNVDVAVGNFGSATVSIFLGNGDGTFRPQVTYGVGSRPQSTQVGDFNGDGIDDLALTNSGDGTVSVLLGNGDGTFRTQVTYPVGGQPVGLVVADFNGDGRQDISVGNTAGTSLTQSFLFGNGDGTFQPQKAFATGNFPYGAALADFNGDGFPDLAISNFNDGTTTVLLSEVTQTASAAISGVSPIGAAGTHQVTANYAGDANFRASVSPPIPLTVAAATPASTTTSLTVRPNAATIGQSVGFLVSVFSSNAQTTAAATGMVTLTNNNVSPATVLGTITLGSTGSGSFSTSSLAPGTYSVTATYGGDTNYAGSVSAAQTLVVSQATSTTTLNVSPASVTVGQPETLSVNLQGSTGVALTGTVTFFDGTILLGSSGVSTASSGGSAAFATASLTLSSLGVGAHQITARYGGDTNYSGSISAPQTVTVVQAATSTSLAVSAASVTVGQPETLTATVQRSGTLAVTGTVAFFDGTTMLGSAAITATAGGGAATLTLTTLSVGTRQIAARYGGDANFSASVSATQSVTVTQVATVTSLITSAANLDVTQTETLTATVAGGATPAVTGAVTFFDGTAIVGTVNITATAGGATAALTLTGLTAATHQYSARYSGDANYAASASGAQTVVVSPVPVVTLGSVAPNSAVVGSTATTVVLTGTNFAARDVVQLNGATISSTFVSTTTLMANLPAGFFQAAGTGQITVVDPQSTTASDAVAFSVIARPAVVFSGPASSTSAQQPTVTLQVVNPYPAAITGTLTLTFAPSAAGGVDDPAVQFATGGRSLTFTIAANSTVTPAVMLQTGTVAGSATVTLGLISNGLNVTPATAAPIVITIATAVPAITTASVTRSGDTFSVVVHGFSNTREVATAIFHFVPIAGSTIADTDIRVNSASAFAQWYGSTTSAQYGSAFTYTQQFTLDHDASVVDSVTVTLVNGVGNSATQSAQ